LVKWFYQFKAALVHLADPQKGALQ